MGEAKTRGTFQERRALARGELLGVKLTTYEGMGEINRFVHDWSVAGSTRTFCTLDRAEAEREAAAYTARNPKGTYVVEALPPQPFPKGLNRRVLKAPYGRLTQIPEAKEDGKPTGQATQGAKWDRANQRARAKLMPHKQLMAALKLRPFKEKGKKRNAARRLRKARAGWPVVLRKADLRPGVVWLRKGELEAIKRAREANGGSRATLPARLSADWMARARAIALGLPAHKRMARPWRLRRRAELAARRAKKLAPPPAFVAEDLVTVNADPATLETEATTAP